MHVNIGTLLPRHATYRPHKTAVIFQNHTFNFRPLNGRVNRMVTNLPNCRNKAVPRNHMTMMFSHNMAMLFQERSLF